MTVLNKLFVLFVFFAFVFSAPLPLAVDWGHSWETVGSFLWIDIAARVGPLSTEQLSFLADTYSIVSLEKCFNLDTFIGNSEAGTRNASAALHALNPNLKVLFYFHMHKLFDNCYASNAAFNHQQWIATDDQGLALSSPPLYNLSIPAMRAYMVDAILAAEGSGNNPADGLPYFDGVFGDGTADAASEYGILPERYAAIRDGSHANLQGVLNTVRSTMRPGAKFIGNGITMYTGNPVDHGLAALPYVDGFCHEHFLGFEQLDRITGALLPAVFATVVSSLRNATAQGRLVLVKAWPGPACQPITEMGPSWCGAEAVPVTSKGRAVAAQNVLIPRLAAFLVLADRLMFFAYHWWYTQDGGGVPCLAGREATCTFPTDDGWFKEFSFPLGAPLGDYSLTGDVYTREYAGASVRFNAGNVSDSWVLWHQGSPSRTPTPSVSPSVLCASPSCSSPTFTPSPDTLASPSNFLSLTPSLNSSPSFPPFGSPWASSNGTQLSGGAATGVALGALAGFAAVAFGLQSYVAWFKRRKGKETLASSVTMNPVSGWAFSRSSSRGDLAPAQPRKGSVRALQPV